MLSPLLLLLLAAVVDCRSYDMKMFGEASTKDLVDEGRELKDFKIEPGVTIRVTGTVCKNCPKDDEKYALQFSFGPMPPARYSGRAVDNLEKIPFHLTYYPAKQKLACHYKDKSAIQEKDGWKDIASETLANELENFDLRFHFVKDPTTPEDLAVEIFLNGNRRTISGGCSEGANRIKTSKAFYVIGGMTLNPVDPVKAYGKDYTAQGDEFTTNLQPAEKWDLHLSSYNDKDNQVGMIEFLDDKGHVAAQFNFTKNEGDGQLFDYVIEYHLGDAAAGPDRRHWFSLVNSKQIKPKYAGEITALRILPSPPEMVRSASGGQTKKMKLNLHRIALTNFVPKKEKE